MQSGRETSSIQKSTPSLMPCVIAVPKVERDSYSAKEEVNAFLGALSQRPSPRWRGIATLLRKKHTEETIFAIKTCVRKYHGIQSLQLFKMIHTSSVGRPVRSNTKSTYLRHAAITELFVHTCTSVFSQVLTYTAE